MTEAPWLSVIGLGEDGAAGLPAIPQTLIATAQVVVGGRRHLDLLRSLIPATAETLPWPTPFAEARAMLERRRGLRVAVLASGDPLWFGVGVPLIRWFGPDAVTVIPRAGAFSLAAARLGWAMQDCLCLSVHGRPFETLALSLLPGRRLLILAEDGRSAARIAALLREHGLGDSAMTVLEHLGGPRERRRQGRAADWGETETADLAVIAVTVAADAGALVLPLVPGLPDEAYLHDGQLTKREVRAVALAALAPLPGQTLWDVGAGCGSVAIEWMRAGGHAIAIERAPARRDRIARNAAALGVPGLAVLAGPAPETLPEGAPDAVFVGGGVSAPGLLELCWQRLSPGGRLVANAVTIQGEAALLAFQAAQGGTLTRLSVARLDAVGAFQVWRPAAPVTQYVGVKPR
jgi:precorrin-6B C5,15-methyltransferase / cobalt-precorrin-6B C5,C15-methyltransferase